jgi:hypothetical protein
MNPSTQEGHPLLRPGGAHPLRFRDLLHRLFSMANQGFLRLDFLQMACGSLLEFLGCDLVEVRLEDSGKVFRCRATAGEGETRFRTGDPGTGPPSAADGILEAVARGQFPGLPPFSTRSGSFWTGDARRPVLLRDGSRPGTPARSEVLGGDHLSMAFVPVAVDDRMRGALHVGSRRADAFTREDVQFFEGVGETLGVAIAFQAAQWALRERVKELDCLYSIAQVAQRGGPALDGPFQEIVDLLPPAWQYPDLASARILLDGKAFTTAGFQEAPWLQEAALRTGDRIRGKVQVVYGKEMPPFDEGPFLAEERSLIEEVARQVGLMVERWEDERARAQLFHMLEQRRE